MRLAVALPSLEPRSLHRQSLDRMMAALVGLGVEVEAFAEHDRLDGGELEVFHYLRMAERHRARPFDLALYPLGRDSGSYQGIFNLMHRFPSIVWFLDPVVHHLALGGIALCAGWWDYRQMLERAHGDDGAAVVQTVAAGWGTNAVFRRYDLAALLAGGQPGVLAAWPALAERLRRGSGRDDIGVVDLGLVEPADGWRGEAVADGSLPPVAIMSLNDSYAESAIRAAEAIFRVDDSARVSICVHRAVYRAAAQPAAERLSIDARVEWVLSPSWEQLAEVARQAGIVLWLAEELQGAHRLVLLQGMAGGKATLVPDCPLYDDLPEGAVAKSDLGASLAPTVAGLLRTTLAEPAFAEGLASAARAFGSACPDVDAAGARLRDELEARLDCGIQEADASSATWEVVGSAMTDAAIPGGAAGRTVIGVAEALDALLAPFLVAEASEPGAEPERS